MKEDLASNRVLRVAATRIDLRREWNQIIIVKQLQAVCGKIGLYAVMYLSVLQRPGYLVIGVTMQETYRSIPIAGMQIMYK